LVSFVTTSSNGETIGDFDIVLSATSKVFVDNLSFKTRSRFSVIPLQAYVKSPSLIAPSHYAFATTSIGYHPLFLKFLTWRRMHRFLSPFSVHLFTNQRGAVPKRDPFHFT